jgi:Laminin EGF domain
VGNKEVTAASIAYKQKQIIPLDRYSDEILKALAQFTGVKNNGKKQIFCNQNASCHCWKGFTGRGCDECKYLKFWC